MTQLTFYFLEAVKEVAVVVIVAAEVTAVAVFIVAAEVTVAALFTGT